MRWWWTAGWKWEGRRSRSSNEVRVDFGACYVFREVYCNVIRSTDDSTSIKDERRSMRTTSASAARGLRTNMCWQKTSSSVLFHVQFFTAWKSVFPCCQILDFWIHLGFASLQEDGRCSNTTTTNKHHSLRNEETTCTVRDQCTLSLMSSVSDQTETTIWWICTITHLREVTR